MQKTTTYQCDICGASYKDEENCRICESFHVHPFQLEAGFFKSIVDFGFPYPEHVLISMKDGALVKYTFEKVIAEAQNTDHKDEVEEQ